MASGELVAPGNSEGNGGFKGISFEMVQQFQRSFTALNQQLDYVIPAYTWGQQMEVVDHSNLSIDPAHLDPALGQMRGSDVLPYGGMDITIPGSMETYGSPGPGSFLAEIPGSFLSDVGIFGDTTLYGGNHIDNSLLQLVIEPDNDGFGTGELSNSELAALSLENYPIFTTAMDTPGLIDLGQPSYGLLTRIEDIEIPGSSMDAGLGSSAFLDKTAADVSIPGGFGSDQLDGSSFLADVGPIYLIDPNATQSWLGTQAISDWRDIIVADNPYLASV